MSYVKIDNAKEINRFGSTVRVSDSLFDFTIDSFDEVLPDYTNRFCKTRYYKRKCRRNNNVAPLIDLNGVADGVDHTGAFFGGDAYAFFLEDATLLDTDDTEIGSLTVTFGGLWGADGSSESVRFGSFVASSEADITGFVTVGSTVFSLEYVSSTGILTITNSEATTFPIGDGESLIRLFEYRNSSDIPTVGDRTFSWAADDGAVSVEGILDNLDQLILDESEEPIYA